MKVLYDTISCDLIGNGGTTRYPVELYKNVPLFVDTTISCVKTNNQYLLDLNYPKCCYNESAMQMNIIKCKEELETEKYHIYHPTDNNDILLQFKPKNTKLVFTVHDCLPEIYNMSSNLFAPGAFEMKRNLIEHADGIICVSEQTKNDLYKFYNIKDTQHVKVIYNGKPDKIYNNVPKLNINFPYILYVGGREIGSIKHKRFLTLLSEFAIYHNIYPNVKLLCVGQPFNEIEKQTIFTNNLTLNDVLYCSANDIQLISLYKYADAFVASAEYEGFGLTPLEAMCYNKKILLNSNNPVFTEIYRDSVLWYDLNKKGSLCDTLCNKFVTTDIINNQQNVLNKYSWKKCAEETVKFYKELL